MTPNGAGHPAGSLEDEAFAATAEAYAGEAGGWERAVQVALARLFAFLAANPTRTTACIVGAHGAGSTALAQRDRAVARFTALLSQGFAQTGAPPPLVAEAIGGGVYEIVRGHVLERRLSQLPAAVPEATVVTLAPLIGSTRAAKLARTENAQTTR